jgi:hypothetical protein
MKITLIGLCSILFLVPLISSATSITTQGDTTFNVDEGDFFLWTITGGDKYNLTIEEIYNGTYMSIDSYMINVSLGYYDSQYDTWWTNPNNAFYVAANETLDFITYSSHLGPGLYLIIPTPINLTMFGEYVVGWPSIDNYTVSSDQITFTFSAENIVYNVKFNSDGILTKYVIKYEDNTTSVIELVTGDKEAIPYGYFFMIFTLIGIISLIYLEKRKIK